VSETNRPIEAVLETIRDIIIRDKLSPSMTNQPYTDPREKIHEVMYLFLRFMLGAVIRELPSVYITLIEGTSVWRKGS